MRGGGVGARLAWSDAEEGAEFGFDFGQRGLGDGAFVLGAAGAPAEAFDLVGEDRAWWGAGDQDLEGVAFYFRGHWAAEHHAARAVVAGGGENQGGAVAGLFVASPFLRLLRVEMQPDDVAGVRHVAGGHHQTS